ncbi:MAG: MBL fold metallo-hydrolase [Thaumarchaeota archaeon]|nr:MBL fold metallo-hydrolase [Candidatus Calditenuaceae archaeon]MDW8042574.1 MBL fold metallo-hydrolase [Nitrososphaerota archaeon]
MRAPDTPADMDLRVETLVVGPLSTNCYIVSNRDDALIVDPGWDVERILSAIGDLRVTLIVATHGHFDHVGAVEELRERLGVEFVMHRRDEELLDVAAEHAVRFGLRFRRPRPDRYIEEGEEIELGDCSIRAIHTPGHSPGSVCLLFGFTLFSGDTLFMGSVGRTDLTGGNFDQLDSSIRRKLYVLDDATIVYPGHGPTTTIGFEKRFNPFVRP